MKNMEGGLVHQREVENLIETYPKQFFTIAEQVLDEGMEISLYRNGGGLRIVTIRKQHTEQTNQDYFGMGTQLASTFVITVASYNTKNPRLYYSLRDIGKLEETVTNGNAMDPVDLYVVSGGEIMIRKTGDKIELMKKRFELNKENVRKSGYVVEAVIAENLQQACKDAFKQ